MVRIGIIDSGVNPNHPHVGNVAGGISLTAGAGNGCYLDYLGHGTAVAAAIHGKAPAAQLWIVKVFDRMLVTRTERILQALEWCLDRHVDVVNLSIGTAVETHKPAFEKIIARAKEQGTLLVAAAEFKGEKALPGSLPGVLSVDVDFSIAREEYRVVDVDGLPRFHASGYPRPIPGIPPERNLSGISFAVANMSGFTALALERVPAHDVVDYLIANSTIVPAVTSPSGAARHST